MFHPTGGHLDDWLRRARALMSFSDSDPQQVGLLLVGAGAAPEDAYLVVKAAVLLGPRTLPRHGQRGHCPSCGAEGIFDLLQDEDEQPFNWISLSAWRDQETERWECHECSWLHALL